MTTTERILTVLNAVMAGLCAGVFFAFSTFIMPALRRLPSSTAIAAMQQINKLAPAALGVVLFAPVVIGVVLVIMFIRKPGPTLAYLIAGTVLVLVGLIVTGGYHVPHNDSLGKISPTGSGSAAKWNTYYSGWTAWNHVRTVAYTLGLACFTLAARTD